ncbi:MAG TPA: PAS domain-containing sensor histidine kinase [Gemmatimonadaceae bacterium]|nr:PAS domain-containing sensor histidine kinase [Gemmatimonadaceae bacterium]
MTSRKRSAAPRVAELSIQKALRRTMQQAPLPFAITRGAEHRLVYANSAFCRLAGIANGNALGVPIAGAFTGAEGRSVSRILDRAFRDGVELLDEALDPSGENASDILCSVWPVIAENGHTEALGIEIRESNSRDAAIDFQRQVAEQMLLGALRERGLADDAEAARRRAAFLAEAGRLLAESVDQSTTLVALTKLALPSLGAWCIVDILEENNAIHRLAIYHPDPDKQKLAEELESSWIPEPDDPFGAPAMLREQRTIAIKGDIDATLAASAHSPRNLLILRQLGIGSLLTVPLVARNRLLGAITFISAQSNGSFSAEDVQLAEDVATRGALALDSAQVYDLALVLQHSAETANRAKTAFLGAMSHELRTPLNAIGGYIDLLDMGLRGPVTEKQHVDFARVRTNQQHLSLLITEILTFVRVGSGRVAYAVADIKACDAVQRAIELVEPLFEQKGLIFDGVSGDTSIVARADPERVTQILVNLLSNAIKFTPKGGHVSAYCSSTKDTVSLLVSDTGIGIAPDKHEAVFEAFFQLKEGLSDRETGVGLGLAISRDLARAMHGDLTVESVEGEGARFTLLLPRATQREESE